MSDWLDDTDLDNECKLVGIIPTSIKQEKSELSITDREDAKMAEMEQKILTESLNVLEQVPGWLELNPQEPEKMPDGWVEKFGEKEATRRHRVAQAALLSERNAPMGLHLHKEMVMNVIKSRKERGGDRQLNIQVVQIPIAAATINYEKIEVDD